MKKKIITFLALLTGIISATAQPTINVANVTVPKGMNGTFKVELENAEEYTAFQMNLTLPDGITYVSASKSSRFADQEFFITEGTYIQFLSYTMSHTPFSGNSGTLFTVKVHADETLEVGTELTATLSGIELTNANDEAVNLGNINFTITIGEPVVVLDEESETVPEATETIASVKVLRTIKANEWSTICLPFTMTKDQVETLFGNDVKVYYFDSYETTKDGDNITAITVNFEEEDFSEGFTKNYPYIIKTSKDITEFNVNAKIEPDEEIDQDYTIGSGKSKKTLGHFYGTLKANTIVPENNLFLSNGKFYYSKGLTKMKAFRCYFDFTDIITSVKDANAPIYMSFGNETTDIKNKQWSIDDNRYYNLNGQHVTNVKKGLYIKNGKKLVVK